MFWKKKPVPKDLIAPVLAKLHELDIRLDALEMYKSVQLRDKADKLAESSGLFRNLSDEETMPGRKHVSASEMSDTEIDVVGDEVVEETWLTKFPVGSVVSLCFRDGMVIVKYKKDE